VLVVQPTGSLRIIKVELEWLPFFKAVLHFEFARVVVVSSHEFGPAILLPFPFEWEVEEYTDRIRF